MRSYQIPRNYKGEGRILYIFSTKGLIYTCVGAGIGLLFFFGFRTLKMTPVGITILVILAFLGFCIGTLKVPEIKSIELTKKTSGQNIDDVIMRWINFKRQKNRIYVNTLPKEEEDTKDGK